MELNINMDLLFYKKLICGDFNRYWVHPKGYQNRFCTQVSHQSNSGVKCISELAWKVTSVTKSKITIQRMLVAAPEI